MTNASEGEKTKTSISNQYVEQFFFESVSICQATCVVIEASFKQLFFNARHHPQPSETFATKSLKIISSSREAGCLISHKIAISEIVGFRSDFSHFLYHGLNRLRISLESEMTRIKIPPVREAPEHDKEK